VDAGIVRTDGRKEHRRSTRNRATPTPGDLVDVDVPDSPTEPDFAAATAEPLTGTETTIDASEDTVKATEDRVRVTEGPIDGNAEADATRAKVNELRKRFRECVERNERAPEAEKLSRSGYCLCRIHLHC
jgi:N-acetyl-beta-hexosaminidase